MFSQEIADRICERLVEGEESLRAICAQEGVKHSTILLWASQNEAFADQYARARAIKLDIMADDLIDIADTPQVGVKTKKDEKGTETTEGDMIEHRRLRVDVRKWYLSKLAPKRYGDKLALEGGDTPLLVKVVTVTSAAEQASAWKPPSGD